MQKRVFSGHMETIPDSSLAYLPDVLEEEEAALRDLSNTDARWHFTPAHFWDLASFEQQLGAMTDKRFVALARLLAKVTTSSEDICRRINALISEPLCLLGGLGVEGSCAGEVQRLMREMDDTAKRNRLVFEELFHEFIRWRITRCPQAGGKDQPWDSNGGDQTARAIHEQRLI